MRFTLVYNIHAFLKELITVHIIYKTKHYNFKQKTN